MRETPLEERTNVELLNAKIDALTSIIKNKNLEIYILKNCLEEIGAQINVSDLKQPDFNNPGARVEFRRTDLHLQRSYIYSLKDYTLLDKINVALGKQQKKFDIEKDWYN